MIIQINLIDTLRAVLVFSKLLKISGLFNDQLVITHYLIPFAAGTFFMIFYFQFLNYIDYCSLIDCRPQYLFKNINILRGRLEQLYQASSVH